MEDKNKTVRSFREGVKTGKKTEMVQPYRQDLGDSQPGGSLQRGQAEQGSGRRGQSDHQGI